MTVALGRALNGFWNFLQRGAKVKEPVMVLLRKHFLSDSLRLRCGLLILMLPVILAVAWPPTMLVADNPTTTSSSPNAETVTPQDYVCVMVNLGKGPCALRNRAGIEGNTVAYALSREILEVLEVKETYEPGRGEQARQLWFRVDKGQLALGADAWLAYTPSVITGFQKELSRLDEMFEPAYVEEGVEFEYAITGDNELNTNLLEARLALRSEVTDSERTWKAFKDLQKRDKNFALLVDSIGKGTAPDRLALEIPAPGGQGGNAVLVRYKGRSLPKGKNRLLIASSGFCSMRYRAYVCPTLRKDLVVKVKGEDNKDAIGLENHEQTFTLHISTNKYRLHGVTIELPFWCEDAFGPIDIGRDETQISVWFNENRWREAKRPGKLEVKLSAMGRPIDPGKLLILDFNGPAEDQSRLLLIVAPIAIALATACAVIVIIRRRKDIKRVRWMWEPPPAGRPPSTAKQDSPPPKGSQASYSDVNEYARRDEHRGREHERGNRDEYGHEAFRNTLAGLRTRADENSEVLLQIISVLGNIDSSVGVSSHWGWGRKSAVRDPSRRRVSAHSGIRSTEFLLRSLSENIEDGRSMLRELKQDLERIAKTVSSLRDEKQRVQSELEKERVHVRSLSSDLFASSREMETLNQKLSEITLLKDNLSRELSQKSQRLDKADKALGDYTGRVLLLDEKLPEYEVTTISKSCEGVVLTVSAILELLLSYQPADSRLMNEIDRIRRDIKHFQPESWHLWRQTIHTMHDGERLTVASPGLRILLLTKKYGEGPDAFLAALKHVIVEECVIDNLDPVLIGIEEATTLRWKLALSESDLLKLASLESELVGFREDVAKHLAALRCKPLPLRIGMPIASLAACSYLIKLDERDGRQLFPLKGTWALDEIVAVRRWGYTDQNKRLWGDVQAHVITHREDAAHSSAVAENLPT